MAPPDGGGAGRHPIRVGAGFLRAPAGERSSPLQHIRAVRRRVRDAAPYEMGRGRHIWWPYTALPASVRRAEIHRGRPHMRRGLEKVRGPRRSPAQHPQGVRRIRKAAKRTIWSLRRRCHAAGWAHGRVAKSGLREKCRSGLCPSPVFSSVPCLSSPMRLPSALLVVTLRVGRMAGALSLGSAKNAAPGCARRLFFRLRPALAPLCAYPPRFFAVTLRLFATPGFPPAPGTNSQFANWPGLYPSLRSIRAAHDGSALLFRQFPQKFFRNLLKRAKRTGIIER